VGDQPEQIAHYEEVISTISPHHFLPHAHPGSILFQFGVNDEKVSRGRAKEMIEVAGPAHEVRWYETDHDFEHLQATGDRMKWLIDKLNR